MELSAHTIPTERCGELQALLAQTPARRQTAVLALPRQRRQFLPPAQRRLDKKQAILEYGFFVFAPSSQCLKEHN
jgi:hypothetical protein